MTQAEPYTLEWVLDTLDAKPAGPNKWMALCPAHDDNNPSLSITRGHDGAPVLNCFAGCPWAGPGGIKAALDERTTMPVTIRYKPGEKKGASTENARVWWEQYTGIPASSWEAWGVRFTKQEVVFTWKETQTKKHRKVGTKEWYWTPKGAAAPPLWPSVPRTLPGRVFLTAGESDLGVLKFLGLPAWAIMKGEGQKRGIRALWPALKGRGVKEIVFVLDGDEAGQAGLQVYANQARVGGLDVLYADLGCLLEPLLGEKDIRDVWTRVQDLRMKDQLLACVHPFTNGHSRRLQLGVFMAELVDDAHWTVEDILLNQTISMWVGAPKLGKTWMILDLGLSIATGKPFMDEFPVLNPGPVVYIPAEDPDYLLHDRFAKLLISKGMGGSIGGRQVRLPQRLDHPFFMDLERSFYFTREHTDDLLLWLKEIEAEYGQISLVIFDPVLRMVQNIDAWKAEEVGQQIFGSAERIRKEMRCGVLMVHHKSKGATLAKDSYGSIAFHAFAEGTQYLLGDEKGKDGWVPVRGEFKSAPETDWSYRFLDLKEEYKVEVERGARTPERKDALRDMIMLLLKDGSSMTILELAERTGSPQSAIKDVLKGLEAAGNVMRDQDAIQATGRKKEIWTLAIDFRS